MNLLVMNYLVTKGYPCTVKNFAAEANIKLEADAELIEERVEIRNAIHSGDIQSAIEKINELDPQVIIPALVSLTILLVLFLLL